MTPPEDPETLEWIARVDRACDDLHLAERVAEIDRSPRFPREEFRALARAGLVGLRTPVRLGGAGLSMVRAGAVLARLAYRSGTTFAKLSLQPEFCSVLAERGSPEQIDSWYRPLVKGELLVGNQVTEPEAGSDAAAIGLAAERSSDGYVLTGAKSEAAFAVDADAAIVYGRVAGGGRGVTAFLVPQHLPGIHRETVPDLGERWMRRGTVRYAGVRIPESARVGEEGAAFEYLKEELTRERALLGAIYLGVGRASWEETVAHAGRRSAFGRPLADQEAVAFPLVEDGARLEAAELYVERVLGRLDQREAAEGPAALAKWLGTHTALEAIDHAIQFHGGRGYSNALPHERRWRDVRSGAIAHGPSEIMHLVAARALWPRGRREGVGDPSALPPTS